MLPDFVVMAIALVVGFAIKSNPKAKAFYLSKLVPVFSFAILFLNQLSAQVADAATLHATVPVALSFGGVLKFLAPAGKAALQTFIVTGLHSAPKNVWEGVLAIAAKVAEEKK